MQITYNKFRQVHPRDWTEVVEVLNHGKVIGRWVPEGGSVPNPPPPRVPDLPPAASPKGGGWTPAAPAEALRRTVTTPEGYLADADTGEVLKNEPYVFPGSFPKTGGRKK